jgi:hypothetical protein
MPQIVSTQSKNILKAQNRENVDLLKLKERRPFNKSSFWKKKKRKTF